MYVPHVRMSALGTLPGGEMFSWGVSLAQGPEGDGPNGFIAKMLTPNDAVWQDFTDDVVTFWAASSAHADARLKTVKFASIGADGKYTAAPVEKIVGGALGTAGPQTQVRHPHQSALAVTLHSAGDLKRVKGRFYLPALGVPIDTEGLITEALRDAVETAAASFINNIGNQPGADALDIRAVIASQGRHNKDGSVRLPPKNHVVTDVSVGRVPDTIRRRRNKLRELRGTITAVNQG